MRSPQLVRHQLVDAMGGDSFVERVLQHLVLCTDTLLPDRTLRLFKYVESKWQERTWRLHSSDIIPRCHQNGKLPRYIHT